MKNCFYTVTTEFFIVQLNLLPDKSYMQQIHVLLYDTSFCLIAVYFKHLIGNIYSLPKEICSQET